jgi:excisionase family DNA binding protein
MAISTGEPLLLTVDEARALCNLGRTKFYELLREREIPSLKVGKAIRIPRKGLEDWIETQTRRSE